MYGHTGVHGNEVADRLADRGALGRVSPHALSWIHQTGLWGHQRVAALPQAPRNQRVRRRPAAANVDGLRRGRHPLVICSKCNEQFRKCDVLQHEPECRGPGAANKTCKYCQKVLGSVMARKNHERYMHAEESLRDGSIGKLAKKRSGA